MIKIKKQSKKGFMLIILIITALLAAGIVFYAKNKKSNSVLITDRTPDNAEQINFGPPTEDERQSGDTIKPSVLEDEDQRNETPSQTPSGKKSVAPTITYAEQYGQNVEVGAYVAGIFEDGGVCTLSLTKDNQTKSVSVNSVKGASSVDCPVMSINVNDLTKGLWQALVTYSSETSEGASQSRAIEVK